MGHDHHFLSRLDRIREDHLDLALGLYRDHEAVRYLLDHLKLRQGHERIALALGRLDKGPYVVLAKNGHFVTCLGEGMSVGGLDIVPRERVTELLQAHRDLRGRESMREAEQRKDENRREFFGRLLKRGGELTREEFLAFSAFVPLIAPTLYWMSIDSAKFVVHRFHPLVGVEKVSPKNTELAKVLDYEYWNVGHCMLLAGMAEREQLDELVHDDVNFSMHCALMASSTTMLRGAWTASRVGKRLIPQYSKQLRGDNESYAQLMDGVISLLTIAFRDKTVMTGVRRELERFTKEVSKAPWTKGQPTIGDGALSVLDDPDGALEHTVVVGRKFYMAICESFPEGDPNRFAKEEDVPYELAATSALYMDLPLFEGSIPEFALKATSIAAIARAEDFYFPRDIARQLPEWDPNIMLERIRRFGMTVRGEIPPARTEKTGRNDPCPCGSGKKYKRCHGAN